jgi:exopolysaccharide biosynthesis polyprenyl glycosylphosphotransferase
MQADILSRMRSRQRFETTRFRISWPLVIVSLVVSDGLALLLAFAVAYLIRFRFALPVFREGTDSVDFYATVVVWALPIWMVIFAFSRLYDRRILFTGYSEYARVGSACTAGGLAIVVISFLYDTPSIARAWLVIVWVSSVGLVWMARFAARRVVRRLRANGYLLAPTLIVGADGEGEALAAQFADDPGAGSRLVGFVEGSTPSGATHVGDLPILGRLGDLAQLVDSLGIEEVVIANGALSRDDLQELYRRFAHRTDFELRISSGLFEILSTGVRIERAGAIPLMVVDRVRITGVDAVLKTLLDYSVALTAVVVLSPVLLSLWLLVKLDAGGPAIYRRRVLGRSGKPFDAFKFRTMIADRRVRHTPTSFPDRRTPDNKVRLDPRITRCGQFLRRTSLDELPQLFNVLRGEMSLIGPRMVSPEEIGRYGKWQMNLLTVKPGITGPWQIRGRSDIPYETRVQLSTEYIRNYSVWLDFQILLQTIPVVLRGHGAY